jgi:hypothetical protein
VFRLNCGGGLRRTGPNGRPTAEGQGYAAAAKAAGAASSQLDEYVFEAVGSEDGVASRSSRLSGVRTALATVVRAMAGLQRTGSCYHHARHTTARGRRSIAALGAARLGDRPTRLQYRLGGGCASLK